MRRISEDAVHVENELEILVLLECADEDLPA